MPQLHVLLFVQNSKDNYLLITKKMKTIFNLIIISTCLSFNAYSQIIELGAENITTQTDLENGNDVINFMYKKYKKAPCKSYTFSQKNTLYRNDSIIGNSVWHESIEFPDKFRIDYDDKTKGNYVIYKSDSVFYFKNSKLKKSMSEQNILLLLLGGMYYREFAETIKRLKKEGFKTDLMHIEQTKQGKVYVIGAKKPESEENQIWVEAKEFKVVKIKQTMRDKSIMEMTFDAHQKNCDGYIETKVTFKRNGKTEQVEEYYDIKTVNKFPANTFKTN